MPLMPADRRLRRILLGILLATLLLRLGLAIGLQHLLDHRWQRQFLIEGDANGYWELAVRLAAGEDFAIYTPPRYVLRMPGFPALLAISIRLFGESLFAARLGLAVVGTIAVWLVSRLGARLFDERTGIVAAALAGSSPVLAAFSVVVLAETSFALTLLLSLLAGQQLFESLHLPESRPGKLLAQSVLTGLAIALGCLMRPSWILAAPIVAGLLILCVPQRRAWAALSGGVVVASLVLALLPWGLRNRAVTGHFTLTTFWMGPSLYDGLNPKATGDSNMEFFEKEQRNLEMDEYEVDQHYRQRAYEFARNHPGRVAELAIAKALRYWNPLPNAEQFQTGPARLATLAWFLPVLLLAIRGILLVANGGAWEKQGKPGSSLRGGAWRIWTIAVLAGPICYFAALHMVFVSSLRYRLPAEYPLLVLSAVGGLSVWRRLTQRDPQME